MASVLKNTVICKGAWGCKAVIVYDKSDVLRSCGTTPTGVNQYTDKLKCPKCKNMIIIKQGMSPGPRSMPSAGGYGR